MFYIFLFIFGACIGSFLNVLIDRLPNDESIMGRSHCDYCSHKLNWFDLFPILSFFWLKGKCRYCGKKLSPIYPLIEVLTAIAFVLTWIFAPADNILVKYGYLGVISSLIVVFFSDLKYQIIPDSIQIAFFVSSLIVAGNAIDVTIFAKKAAAALIIMAPIYFLHAVTKGKGMGFGDVKLAFTIGFLLGIKGGIAALYIGFILGAAVGLILLGFKKKGLRSKIPFGPFLVLGVLIVLFFQSPLFALIKRIYGI